MVIGACARVVPIRENYQNKVSDFGNGNYILLDENNDGKVDYIEYGVAYIIDGRGYAYIVSDGYYFISKEYADSVPRNPTRTIQLPSEVIDLASKIKNLQEELRFKLDSLIYLEK